MRELLWGVALGAAGFLFVVGPGLLTASAPVSGFRMTVSAAQHEAGDTPGAVTGSAGQPGWLRYVNRLRALGGLAPVGWSRSWSRGDRLHARYMVKNEVLSHAEDPAKPWYTPAGAASARSGHVMASSTTSTSNRQAIDVWMTGPFHGVGIIDPELRQAGYGAYRESDGGWEMAATLDVLRGLRAAPTGLKLPVMWPGDGVTTPLRGYYGGEFPDPLASCPDYTAPAGAPIILQVGLGSGTPNVAAHSLRTGGVAVEHCIYSESTYTSPDSSAQSLGRAVLSMRDAIVIMPRSPLTQGADYEVSITADGNAYTWTFRVSEAAR